MNTLFLKFLLSLLFLYSLHAPCEAAASASKSEFYIDRATRWLPTITPYVKPSIDAQYGPNTIIEPTDLRGGSAAAIYIVVDTKKTGIYFYIKVWNPGERSNLEVSMAEHAARLYKPHNQAFVQLTAQEGSQTYLPYISEQVGWMNVNIENQSYVLSVSTPAPGRNIQSAISEFIHKKYSKTYMTAMFRDLGLSLAAFQWQHIQRTTSNPRNWLTARHGDLQAGNINVLEVVNDPERFRISFFDMQSPIMHDHRNNLHLRRGGMEIDLLYFMFTSIFFHDQLRSPNFKEDIFPLYETFLRHYIEGIEEKLTLDKAVSHPSFRDYILNALTKEVTHYRDHLSPSNSNSPKTVGLNTSSLTDPDKYMKSYTKRPSIDKPVAGRTLDLLTNLVSSLRISTPSQGTSLESDLESKTFAEILNSPALREAVSSIIRPLQQLADENLPPPVAPTNESKKRTRNADQADPKIETATDPKPIKRPRDTQEL